MHLLDILDQECRWITVGLWQFKMLNVLKSRKLLNLTKTPIDFRCHKYRCYWFWCTVTYRKFEIHQFCQSKQMDWVRQGGNICYSKSSCFNWKCCHHLSIIVYVYHLEISQNACAGYCNATRSAKYVWFKSCSVREHNFQWLFCRNYDWNCWCMCKSVRFWLSEFFF